MGFLVVSFLAGVLTVLAPCVVMLLPVVLGGSVGGGNKFRPLIVSLSLGVSVIIFSLLLKASTLLLPVPDIFWKLFSGGIILIFGFLMLVPEVWDWISVKLKLYKSEELVQQSGQKKGIFGPVLLGFSLGPVFNTCSPTYFVILGFLTDPDQSFLIGFLNLISYTLGLVLLLLLIGYGGRTVVQKLRFAANPKGWFRRIIGLLLIVVGIMIMTGLDKKFETAILESGYLGPIGIETSLKESLDASNNVSN